MQRIFHLSRQMPCRKTLDSKTLENLWILIQSLWGLKTCLVFDFKGKLLPFYTTLNIFFQSPRKASSREQNAQERRARSSDHKIQSKLENEKRNESRLKLDYPQLRNYDFTCPNFEDATLLSPCHNIEHKHIYFYTWTNTWKLYFNISIFLQKTIRSSCQSIRRWHLFLYRFSFVYALDTFQWVAPPPGAVSAPTTVLAYCKLDRFSIIPFIPSGEQGTKQTDTQTQTRFEIKNKNCLNGWQSEILFYTDASYAYSFDSWSTTRRELEFNSTLFVERRFRRKHVSGTFAGICFASCPQLNVSFHLWMRR